MILKVADNEHFNLSMKLNICYKGKYIDIIVKLENKLTNKVDMRSYTADNFDAALSRYEEWLEFFFGEEPDYAK